MARKITKDTAAISYGSVLPRTFGAGGDVVNSFVSFGIGTIDKIIDATDASLGMVAFGFDTELNTGAIAIGGELVSSKILDIIPGEIVDGKQTIQVVYLDPSNGKQTTEFTITDPESFDTWIDELDSSISTLNSSVNTIEDKIPEIDSSITTLNSSVNTIEDNYVKEVSPVTGSPIIVTDVTPTGTKGKVLNIDVSVDNATVKITDGKLTAAAAQYRLVAAQTPTEDMFKTYQLQSKVPGEDSWSDVQDSVIDIPKDYVLKEVHICKAELNGGDYTETSRPGDQNWDTDTHPQYLHFIWQTKEPAADDSESYILITDLAPIYTGDADSDSSAGKYINVTDEHVVTFDSSKFATDFYDTSVAPIDASLQQLYQEVIDNELVIASYTGVQDLSINMNTASIETLGTQMENLSNVNASIALLNSSIADLEDKVDVLEDGFVEDVDASIDSSDIDVRNSYGNEPEVTVQDGAVTYTITKTVNGVDTTVTTIQTIDTAVIDKIAEILASDASKIDDLQHKMVWINL